MDAYRQGEAHQTEQTEWERARAPELAQWLEVSGDLDDFIYYGEEARPSER